MKPFRKSIYSLLFLLCAASAAKAATITENSTGITVKVEPGGFEIDSDSPAWMFSGPVHARLKKITAGSGDDKLGHFQIINFRYFLNGRRAGSIRIYVGRPVVIFSEIFIDAGANTDLFPGVETYPTGLFHLSYKNEQFSPASFDEFGPNSPWVFFDSGRNTFVFSPADNFMIASNSVSGGVLTAGIHPVISNLPADFTHQTILVMGYGIRHTMNTWGQALTDLSGKTRPANDSTIELKSLGYWTDNGARYYYDYEPSLGYQGTLLGVKKEFGQKAIGLGYMQLDSWWYQKGADAHWTRGDGIYLYVEHPDLFPGTNGLKTFQASLGLPLVTHSRWLDPASPYRTRFPAQMSNNVCTATEFWNEIIGHISEAGSVTYEQDWLDELATPDMTLNAAAFTDNMALACKNHGLSMQYCMPTPRHYLQSSRYNNLVSIRVSPDRFSNFNWVWSSYDSLLASSLGIWPWNDVCMSGEVENVQLQTLSGGVVGTGDELGQINKEVLLKAVRPDGVIVKPDFPLAVSDDSLLSDAQHKFEGLISSASTSFASGNALYVTAHNYGRGSVVHFVPSHLDSTLTGQVYIYDTTSGRGTQQDAGAIYNASLQSTLDEYVVVPMQSGIAVLGDLDMFVPLGKQRVKSIVRNSDGSIDVTVLFAAGEQSRTISVAASVQPRVTALLGGVGTISHDGLFRIPVLTSAAGTATIRLN